MEALGEYGRPLFGRFRELVLPPLSPSEVARILGLGASEALDAYLVTGGFPRLVSLWRDDETPMDFVRRELGEVAAPLIVTAERVLGAELPAHLAARDVLRAIGAGERSFDAIGRDVGLSATTLERSLAVLDAKRLTMRSLPYSSRPNPRTPRYVLADPYLRFWLRFVGPNLDLLSRRRPELVVDRIQSAWLTYRGKAIEPIVRGVRRASSA